MYVYFAPDLARAGVFEDASLAQTSERHHLELAIPPLNDVASPSAAVSASAAAGAVFELGSGLPSTPQLRFMDDMVKGGHRAWMYWPAEQAIECVDAERLDSLRRHVDAVKWLKRIAEPIDRNVARWQRAPTGLRWIYRGEFPVRRSDILVKLTLLSLRAQPVSLTPNSRRGSSFPIGGVGLYLRTDYWTTSRAPAEPGARVPGGSDAHAGAGGRAEAPVGANEIAGELACVTERVVCLAPCRDPLLDRTNAQQIVMDPPRVTSGEDAIVLAPAHYWPIVKATCQSLLPAYIYEPLSAGQSVGAELSQLLNVPYIVEYPGGEALVRGALNGAAPFYPELYAKAEELALRQATVVRVTSPDLKDNLISRGIEARRVLVDADHAGAGTRLVAFIESLAARDGSLSAVQTGDAYKDQVQAQWNQNPVGSQHARESQPHTLDWFLEVERHRYGVYAPWMPEVMEFAGHAGHDLLEIGGGMGTDLAQFARHGAVVTDIDLSAGHLKLAEENFRFRGLPGRFIHHDAESLPFEDASFDVVYSNGVLHHTPNTAAVVREIHRVLRPGGRTIVMLYAEDSLHYWRKLVWLFGVKEGLLDQMSMGAIMSRTVERSANEARPLVKVYTRRRAAALFERFDAVEVLQRQLLAEELPTVLRWTLPYSERRLGWNLIVKATKR